MRSVGCNERLATLHLNCRYGGWQERANGCHAQADGDERSEEHVLLDASTNAHSVEAAAAI
jgi:hypothetical protein